jgi:nucleoside phosphorylase
LFLVVTPLKQEARALAQVLDEQADASKANLSVLGVMGQDAAPVVESLLEKEKPEGFISLGFAGALNNSLKEGDLVLGAKTGFYDRSGDFSNWASSDERLLERAKDALDEAGIGHRVGNIVTTPKVVGSPAEKGSLGATTNGLVVDMESSWIAGVAEKAGIPVLLVRVVLDKISLKIPRMMMFAASKPAWVQWLWGGLVSLVSPWNMPSLMELRRCSNIAEESLASFLRAFLAANLRMAAAEESGVSDGGGGR